MTDRLPYPPPFQDIATLAEHICAGESTIENWVRMGIFPAPRLQGGKRLWSWKEVERHLAGAGDSMQSMDDLMGRIKDGTRRAAHQERHLRISGPPVHGIEQVPEPRPINAR